MAKVLNAASAIAWLTGAALIGWPSLPGLAADGPSMPPPAVSVPGHASTSEQEGAALSHAPFILRDGRPATAVLLTIGFAEESADLAAGEAERIAGQLGPAARPCVLSAQVIGHAAAGEPPARSSRKAQMLARARADAVQRALVNGGLAEEAIASLWTLQQTEAAAQTTLWLFRLAEPDCGSQQAAAKTAVAPADLPRTGKAKPEIILDLAGLKRPLAPAAELIVRLLQDTGDASLSASAPKPSQSPASLTDRPVLPASAGVPPLPAPRPAFTAALAATPAATWFAPRPPLQSTPRAAAQPTANQPPSAAAAASAARAGKPSGGARPNFDAATQALFSAVETNNIAAVQATVRAGADISARDLLGRTPADVAVDKSHYEIAHFLTSLRQFRRSQAARPVRPASGKIAKNAPRAANAKAASLNVADYRPGTGG
jgi:hypothetical protein